MKTKQKQELRAKEIRELTEEVLKREDEIARLRIEIKMVKVKDTTSVKRKRDELAILKTIIKEKEFKKEASLK
jgi:ribosomal protein L29